MRKFCKKRCPQLDFLSILQPQELHDSAKKHIFQRPVAHRRPRLPKLGIIRIISNTTLLNKTKTNTKTQKDPEWPLRLHGPRFSSRGWNSKGGDICKIERIVDFGSLWSKQVSIVFINKNHWKNRDFRKIISRLYQRIFDFFSSRNARIRRNLAAKLENSQNFDENR